MVALSWTFWRRFAYQLVLSRCVTLPIVLGSSFIMAFASTATGHRSLVKRAGPCHADGMRGKKRSQTLSKCSDLTLRGSERRATSGFSSYMGNSSIGAQFDLRQTFLDLRRRHIALALEIGVAPPHDQCGGHVEGYIDPSLLEKVIARFSRLGRDLQYLAMDEPLTGAEVCHTDISIPSPRVSLRAQT